ncbi:MAG: hypothetical protein JNN30_17025 [Rhodanobacteraceae bacterium]|nr:hypothetical protein [Rhodanobacteraceae bacterium]
MKPTPDPNQPNWTEQARSLLEASTQSLDAATLSRLNRARQRALAVAQRPANALRWAPGLAAAALLLAVLFWWPYPKHSPAEARAPTLLPEDAELLAEGEFEMTDDPEFYAWLDADGEHNG